MTIAEKWHDLAHGALASSQAPYDLDSLVSEPLTKAEHYFIQAFALMPAHLPVMFILEATERISAMHFDVISLSASKSLASLLHELETIGWIQSKGDVFRATPMYQERLEGWQDRTWDEDYPVYQPQPGDVHFPMRKAFYEQFVERLSDDLQSLQMNVVAGLILESDLTEDEKAQTDKETVFALRAVEQFKFWEGCRERLRFV